ncbi:ATP-dependent nuclease [Yersinia mollaretii]|uniref:Arginine transporter ATP-binding subunit n=1 Tax=Yersinia mollaretii TaxID=33060 RepID=A0AA36LQM4_YERMO|nr:AAA family ATPase [Yersinia mollaretii]CNI77413.1 arginine transporter ATP-binding subunit [Yersinia mollaretii]
MAKAPKIELVSLVTENDNVSRPRLHKLIIKNFRSIGSNPVDIELDDIVVLVGPNNAGKSSILRAYETVMMQGSKEGRLSIHDFPNGIVDANNLPEIELQTIVYNKAPGDKWIKVTDKGELLIRELWKWDSPNKDPVRQGFNVDNDSWDDQVPWGAPNVANSRRPRPHRIDAFASPDEQTKDITKLITDLLKTKLASFKSDPHQEKSDYEVILENIKKLQTNAVSSTEKEIQQIEDNISFYLSKLFPNHKVKFDAKPETDLDKAYTPFKTNADLLMGPTDGYFSTIENQGSGARRTILWATLKYLSESADEEGARPHVLLLDEPEICLHPSAIREARQVLYDLPKSGNWQVMITSHSPIFIDLSKNNTTIIRVYRGDDSKVQSTTLYRPSRAKLDDEDRKNMKLLNICDPYMHEFFFGGRQVVVEGDTEYTAFSYLKEIYPDEYRDLHVIRARGKGIIPSVAKVLIQFSKSFSILHDTDTPITSARKGNPAWGMNNTIAKVLELEGAKDNINLVACKTCFETALFGYEVKSDKPYNTLVELRTNPATLGKVKELLDYLLDIKKPIPANCINWRDIAELA